MNVKNARLTPRWRERIVRRDESCQTPEAVAKVAAFASTKGLIDAVARPVGCGLFCSRARDKNAMVSARNVKVGGEFYEYSKLGWDGDVNAGPG